MKRFLLITIWILFVQIGFSQIPSGYYDSATGTGYTLKTQLHNIIDDHTIRTYDNLWTDMQSTDKKPNGYVWDMYSDVPGGSPAYDYTFGTDQCGNYSGEGSCYNREHSFPKSWFNDASPMYTDLFHLVPTDGYVNGKRSNYPFGEVGTATWTSTNGSKLGSCSYPGYAGTVFEPIDEYKGDFARGYFYMATRYEDVISSWPGSDMLDGSNDQCYTDWALELLIDWHNNDPVSQKEIDRNNAVHDIQNNRNPFIDHPEYVAKIWGGSGVYITNINQSPTSPTSSDVVTITADITSSGGTITTASLKWGTSTGSYSSTVNMTSSKGNYSGNIPAGDDGTTVYYIIEASDDNSESAGSGEYNYTINDNPSTEILNEDFTTCPATDWISYDVSGSENWECGTGYMQINAYESDVACEDWLITPAIDLDSYDNEILTFTSWTKFNDSFYPPIELIYSTDYIGSGDPNSATWQSLSATWSAENSEAWTESGNIDLSSIIGPEVYFAFKYTSSGTGAETSAYWEIDDVLITGTSGSATNQLPQITNIQKNPTSPTENEDVTISATITDTDGSVTSAKVKWGTISGTYSQEIVMTAADDVFSGTIAAQAAGTTIYFVVEAIDNDEGNTTSVENTVSFTSETNDLPQITNVDYSPKNPESTQNVTVSATITDTDGTISTAKIKYGTSTGNYQNEVIMTGSGSYTGTIPAHTDGTAVYFIVEATDNELGATVSTESNYTVEDSEDVSPEIANVSFSPASPSSEDDVMVSCEATDADGTIASVLLRWKKGTDGYTDVNMSLTENKYYGQIPAQNEGETVNFVIVAQDNSGLQVSYNGSYQVSESTGLVDLSLGAINIYPNPTRGQLTFETSSLDIITSVTIYNLIGEKIRELNNLDIVKYTLDIGDLPKGMYIVKVDGKENSIVKRVILR